MKVQYLLLAFLLVPLFLAAEDVPAPKKQIRNSYVEFPEIVMVGKVVEITPYSIIVENSDTGTNIDNSFVAYIREKFAEGIDFRDHGFANALKLVTVKDGHMRLNFYLDNIPSVFHFDVSTYTQFLPLFFIVEHNLKKMKIPAGVEDALRTPDALKYLKIPFIHKLLDNSWFIGVFTVHPQTGKLVYDSSRYYSSLDELLSDDFAQEHRVPDMIHRGLTVSVVKAIVRGHEADHPSNQEGSGSSDSKGNIGTGHSPIVGGGS